MSNPLPVPFWMVMAFVAVIGLIVTALGIAYIDMADMQDFCYHGNNPDQPGHCSDMNR